jgi:hypothetical protein
MVAWDIFQVHPSFYWGSCYLIFVFCVVLNVDLCLPFFVLFPLCCLSFFDLPFDIFKLFLTEKDKTYILQQLSFRTCIMHSVM